MTAQGHPRAIYKRAIERGNLLVAEMAAREVGSLTLVEALELVCLYAEHEPAKFERAALRWHGRCGGWCVRTQRNCRAGIARTRRR